MRLPVDVIPGEVWRSVEGYEGLYEVSDLGRVKSLARVVHAKDGRKIHYTEKLLRVNEDSRGYLQVCLCNHTKRKTWLVHRLVAIAFLGHPPQGMEVCHNDGTRNNNRITNLRYGTRSENTLDKYEHGTHNWQHTRPRRRSVA